MLYYSGLIQILLVILVLFITIETIKWINHLLLLKELKTIPFPSHYEKVLKKIPYYNLLSQDLKLKLHYKMMIFIEEKEWLGIKKDVTYEMKVVISFYACLMIVNLDKEVYENLSTIYVYPYEFILDEVKSYDGIYTKEKFILEGQSSGGVVIISWHNAKREAYHFKNHNVIIHEFAHELDFEDGVADGVPVLDNLKYKAWADVMFKTYKALNAKSLTNRFWGKYKLFGSSGAINTAEFFAVASEVFFEKPKSLRKNFPEVYEQLKQFYKIDTIKLFIKGTN
ncbi:MAG: zinc-dependent peptidase [Arcobacteraceae bacterium]|nr:zinc-dependent peptidase [Arcobacteraceae bacterium]